MSLVTVAGKASIGLVCATFKLSRLAYYAAGAAPVSSMIALPKKARYTAVEVVLIGIRRFIDANPAWGSAEGVGHLAR
jgi:hypothetical protein